MVICVQQTCPDADIGVKPNRFCVQVWMALLYKDIPFDVVFIELRNKPDWYETIVPTKLVPAVRMRDSGEVVYESADIMKVRLQVDTGQERFSRLTEVLRLAPC